MAWSLLVVPSSGLRWRTLAAAVLGGGLVAAALGPSGPSRAPTVRTAAVVTAPAPARAQAPLATADDCRPALETWSARRAAAQDSDGRFRAERERAIDACLAPRR